MARKIHLGKRKFAIVDDEDYGFLNRWKWSFNRYAYRGKKVDGKQKNISMHRVVMDVEKGQQVDHINGNKLDNRKANLRIATHSDNTHNKKKCRGGTPYKGVIFEKDRKKYRAAITLHRKIYYLGRFKSPEDAARAYNKKAKELYGRYANLNKIKTMR